MIQKINSVLPVARGHFAMKMKVGVCDRDPDNITPLLKKNQNPSKFFFFCNTSLFTSTVFFKIIETSEPVIYLIMIDICKLCF